MKMFHSKFLTMRAKLGITILLFLLPSNIYGSKGNQKDDDLAIKDVTNGKAPDTTSVKAADKISETVVKTLLRRNTAEFTDDNDYAGDPLCGDKPMSNWYTCYCGNITLSGVTDLSDGEYHCCVSPPVHGEDQCKYVNNNGDDPRESDVRCENGEVRRKTEPCNQKCWNSYAKSKKLYEKATLYCQEEAYCLPLDQMCSGVCREEAEFCGPDSLRCIGDGFEDGYWYIHYSIKSLETKLGKDHGYCLKINNDQAYDTISRADEEKILGTHEHAVNYTWLVKCNLSEWNPSNGILCSGECMDIRQWCAGTNDVCNTTYGIVSLDSPELCSNATYWYKNNFSCDLFKDGKVQGVGARCSGAYQHCTWPWYSWFHGGPSFENPTCVDSSDQVFAINTTCQQFNQQFLDSYETLWCSGNIDRWQGRYCGNLNENCENKNKDCYGWAIIGYCKTNPDYMMVNCPEVCGQCNVHDWFAKQDNTKITDPHGCQNSCKSATSARPDCIACEHPDFFNCNSTGFCINKKNVCDGHPHPSCGGDDEGIDHCLEIYFKMRIVKRYATFICPSKMYPGNYKCS